MRNRILTFMLPLSCICACAPAPPASSAPEIDSSCLNLLERADEECNVYREPDNAYDINRSIYFCPNIPQEDLAACSVLCDDVAPCFSGDSPPQVEGIHDFLPSSGDQSTIEFSAQSGTSISLQSDSFGYYVMPSRLFGTPSGDFTIYYSESIAYDGGPADTGVNTFIVIGGNANNCKDTPLRGVRLSGQTTFSVERFDVKCVGL